MIRRSVVTPKLVSNGATSGNLISRNSILSILISSTRLSSGHPSGHPFGIIQN
jgi:hypothetical protein